jgi:cell division protein FtsL
MSTRLRPTRPPSKLMPAILMLAIAILGFTTLMIRLETTREGYRLSSLNDEISHLESENRALRLKVAQLSSHERLRSLASEHHLGPPGHGQVVMAP